jgi:tetrahydromethanopterin S-methyltransferase subunit A
MKRKKMTKEEWKREFRKARKEGRDIPGLPGCGGKDDMIIGVPEKEKERKEMSREEAAEEMVALKLRIEQLEWEMEQVWKSKRLALRVLKRAGKAENAKKRKK